MKPKLMIVALVALVVGGVMGYFLAPKIMSPPKTKSLQIEKIKGDTLETIPFDEAAGIMFDFLSDGNRLDLARLGYSGDFPVSYFNAIATLDPDDSTGIALWFCLDIQKEFFLALEATPRKYSSLDKPREFPDDPTLYKPARVYSFNHPASTLTDVMDFLAYDSRPPIGLQPILKKDAIDLIKNFGHDWSGESKYSFSFFAENNPGDLQECLRLAGPDGFLRYYIGYEGAPMIQRFRVILAAVDKNGDTQVIKSSFKSGGDGLIQSSWPPPPSK